MERSTKEIITPKEKHKILIVEWISGAESEEIEASIKDVRFKIDSLGQGTADMNVGEAIRKSVEIAVNIIVLKIDGEARDIWKRVQELRKTDYDFVLEKVDRITRGLDFEPPVSKKKDGTD